VERKVEAADKGLAEAITKFQQAGNKYEQATVIDESYRGNMFLVALYTDSHRCFQGIGHRSPKAAESCKPLTAVGQQRSSLTPHVVGLPTIKRAMWGECTSMEEYLAVEGQLSRLLWSHHLDLFQMLCALECWICVMDHLVPYEKLEAIVALHDAFNTVIRGAQDSAASGVPFEDAEGNTVPVDELCIVNEKLSVSPELMVTVLERCLGLREFIGPGMMSNMDLGKSDGTFTLQILDGA
jgi:hypothetical protein